MGADESSHAFALSFALLQYLNTPSLHSHEYRSS